MSIGLLLVLAPAAAVPSLWKAISDEPPATASQGSAEPVAAAGSEPERFTVLASGDILIHRAVYERAREYGRASGKAFDFRPMFKPIRPIVSKADLAICHLEVPLGAPGPLSSYPVFNAPRQVARGIRYAGFDKCSTASNHSYDQGTPGIYSTIDSLHDRRVGHEGTARTRKSGRRAAMYNVGGVKVGHVSFTYGLNGFKLPEGKSWLANVINAEEIIRQARGARRRGAEFVIASLHWGNEYQRAPSGFQRDLARRLMKSRAINVILGHHAHVVQGITTVRRRFVVYGMGNFISAQYSPVDTQDGLIVKLVVEKVYGRWKVVRIRFTPTWVARNSYRILPVARTYNRPGTSDHLKSILKASWSRTVSAVHSLGRDERVKPSSRPKF
ncbi:MAG: CapA family protein [Actinobacteria bacterium]|nr:CapA family protein [Actinomycetota bacterium]